MNRPVSSPSIALDPRDQAGLNQQQINYSSIQSLPEIWPLAAQKFGPHVALQNPHARPQVTMTYAELFQQIQQFAAGLQVLGVQAGDRISLFADNSARWFIADQGALTAGAVDVVRSSQADRDELLFILVDSESTVLIAENLATLKKLRAHLNDLPIRLVILLSDEQAPDQKAEPEPALKVLPFSQLMSLGQGQSLQPVKLTLDTLASLIYTSGTTGKPKGVMMSHGNLLHQINTLCAIVQPQVGDRVLSILPTWHTYERTAEYFLLSQGCTQIYTNLRSVKRDLKQYKPNYMVGVPRLWESIYEGVQKQFREQPASKQKLIFSLLDNSQRYVEARRIAQGLSLEHQDASAATKWMARLQAAIRWLGHKLAEKIVYGKVREATGGQIKQMISGGGSLAKHIDTFFEMVGVEILVGYGLTETAPVLTARRPWRNLRGSSGRPLPYTEIRIVHPETQQPLPQGQQGLVVARGPQVMQGYYKNPTATTKAIDSEGWFDTGDLGWLTRNHDLVLTGRAKDTIVLTNGENIEPQPIEDACQRSAYIDQIMLVGQDQRSLGALIVPNLEALQKWAASQNLHLPLSTEVNQPPPGLRVIDLDSKEIQDLLRQELTREVKDRPGYRSDDRIGPFCFILEPFSIENGMMTQTLKIKRPIVTERYRVMIDGLFS
ncbi:MAG: long-chain fatty acid--CoA ligase [Cyanothece sp. SIO1E1]|nr:long-chain fatty acid--CoA ligase [Cyanothece sp. SIO1E1]